MEYAAEGKTLSADMEEEIYRGLDVVTLLQAGPFLHRSNVGGADTSRMSKQLKFKKGDVQGLELFLSHTWRSSSILKYILLCFMFNAEYALFVVYASIIPFTLLGWFLQSNGITLPSYDTPIYGGVMTMTLFVTLGSGIFGTLAFFFGHLLPSRKLDEKYVFLDKCCIEQVDLHKKMKGIASLGGFLHYSKGLAVLWDKDYFERLWCVYELAARVHVVGVSDTRPLTFHSLHEACFATLGFFVCVAYGPLSFAVMKINEWSGLVDPALLSSLIGQIVLWTLYGSPAFWIPKYTCCHMTVSTFMEMKNSIQNFKVEDTKVTDEADRPVVEGSIKAWFGSLANFNQKIRANLWSSLEGKVGNGVMPPYFNFLLKNVPLMAHLIGDGFLASGGSYDLIYRWLFFAFLQHFVSNPLGMAGFGHTASLTIGIGKSYSKVLEWALRIMLIPIVGLWWPISCYISFRLFYWQQATITAIGSMGVYFLYFRETENGMKTAFTNGLYTGSSIAPMIRVRRPTLAMGIAYPNPKDLEMH